MNWFTDISNIWAVPLYPLLAFIAIVLIRAFNQSGQGFLAKKELCSGLTIFATFLGLLHTLLGAIPWLFGGEGPAHKLLEHNWAWLKVGSFTLSLGYLLDGMSVMMLFVVTFISILIQCYTHGYMNHDKGYAKFFGYLALFNFSMLGLVLSTNMFQIYIFWELVGVSSYLLIGFWFQKPSAAAACMKAFLMNRVGDFGLLFGILGFLYITFSIWQNYLVSNHQAALLSFSALPAFAPYLKRMVDPNLLALVAVLLFMGPMAKSAQLPLHTWLPDAMEGPTPISALIHAATMVAAGVFLIGRLYPVFTSSEVAMIVVSAIGTLSAVVAATIALTQYDIKKALAYSTMSQLGFMVAAMGVGAFTAGLFHLFTHAFFKAMLFLCSGSVIHACEDEQDMRKMGGLASKLPITNLAYLVGTLAISGLLWTSGFWSKDEILLGAKSYSSIIYWSLAFTAGLTAFYMFRTYFLTFCGKYRGEAHVHHEDTAMTWPLVVLMVPSALIGVLMAGLKDVTFLPSFSSFVHYGSVEHEASHTFMHAILSPVGLTSLLIGLSGALLAALFYLAMPAIPERIKSAPLGRDAFRLFSNKWYFDDLYQGFVDRVYLAFARGSSSFDKEGIDGVVNTTGRVVMGGGYALRQLQSGKVQTYIAVMFFAVVTLSLLLFYWLM